MLKKFSMIVSVVALLTLALVGCKNGMLGEDDATVNGVRDVSEGRTANVTVTNYAGTGATRSAAGGSLRTIAPDETNLVAGGFTFVAEGKSGRNVLEPKIVALDPNGVFDLPGLTPGVWSITLTAFDTAKLQGQTTDANAIKGMAATAAVLSGVATVDLTRSSGNVRITLTPRNIGTEGTVTLRVNFNANDQNKIANRLPATTDYKVEIGLYHRGTGAAIQAAGATTVEDVTTDVRRARQVTYDLTQVPVGEYTFKVTITNETDPQKGPWYWSDNLFVHGNMDTNQEVDLDELLGGTTPADPANFAVYWANNNDKTDPSGNSYTAHFAWDKKSYNESGFILQIADITEHFTPETQNYDGVVVNSGANLWAQIEQKGHNDTITKITAADFARDQYPIYDKDGTLLAGSTYVDYELLSGRLYTARICATNFGGDSNWVYLGVGNEPTSKWQAGGTGTLNVQEGAKLDGYYFDVFSVTYQLRSFLLLKQAEQITAAVKGDVDYHAFAQGQGYTVKYQVAMNAGDATKYQLYPSTFQGPANFDSPDRNKSWKGWTNATDIADGNVYGDNPGNTQYTRHTNVTLIPAGASNSLGVDVITAGTFKDLLTEDTVFIQLKEETAGQTSPQGITWNNNNKWNQSNTNIQGAIGQSQVGNVNGKKGISLPDTIQAQVKDYLCVTVGNDPAQPGKLNISTGNGGTRETTVYQMVLNLEQNGTVIASGMSNPGDPYVYADVTTLAEGDYTLRLYALPAEGYGFSFQKPFVVKNRSTIIL